MASVQDCDYVQELITHSQEVKCSRGQEDQLDPAVVWIIARARNVWFDTWMEEEGKRETVKQIIYCIEMVINAKRNCDNERMRDREIMD